MVIAKCLPGGVNKVKSLKLLRENDKYRRKLSVSGGICMNGNTSPFVASMHCPEW